LQRKKDNLSEDDCKRSNLGCKWYKEECIKAEKCNELSDYTVCLNNTDILKDKCEWYEWNVGNVYHSYCREKSEINYNPNCKDITNEDCQKGLNGCYWISEKCIFPTQCSDFNEIICQDINSYSSFSGKCELNEKTKKCQRRALTSGLCSDNIDENDCSRSLIGCVWINNTCVIAHHCNLLSQSVCENLGSNARLRGLCEYNEKTKKCQRRALTSGLCSDNIDENDCSRSLIGCVWINNTCVIAHHCNLLSQSVCENLGSNARLRGLCEYNEKTKKCQRRALTSGLCSENIDENDCSRSLIGCVWINNTCVIAHQCNLLSQSVCENLGSNARLRGKCEWNKDDEICLQKKSIRLIRNLVDDEITTKYKCSFNFPNIVENKNFDLIILDKNNNKASISLLLNSSESSNEDSDDNKFIIYRSSSFFLKNNLLVSFFLISFYL